MTDLLTLKRISHMLIMLDNSASQHRIAAGAESIISIRVATAFRRSSRRCSNVLPTDAAAHEFSHTRRGVFTFPGSLTRRWCTHACGVVRSRARRDRERERERLISNCISCSWAYVASRLARANEIVISHPKPCLPCYIPGILTTPRNADRTRRLAHV